MSDRIVGKIDVTKINKAFLFKGAKGIYLDIALLRSNGKYDDDYMIVQSVPKAEREKGTKGPIIGNAKIFGDAKPEGVPNESNIDDSYVPF